MSIYALNPFDLADNNLYRQYSRRSVAAVGKHGGMVVALGGLDEAVQTQPGVEPRTVMVLVEWPSRAAFDAFLEDPEPQGSRSSLHGLGFAKPNELEERILEPVREG
jgi:uncharacterized protein (DUF1330 family)